jgi:hypothetical protein
MRYTRLAFMLLGLAAALVAADPFVGTWKLNPAKSKYKTGAPPKEQTVTISEEGGDLHIMVQGISSDGKTVSTHYSLPAKGGTGKVLEGPWDGISTKRISENQRETSYSQRGKVVYTIRSRVSADGKIMTTSVKGTNAYSQMVDGTQVMEKQ